MQNDNTHLLLEFEKGSMLNELLRQLDAGLLTVTSREGEVIDSKALVNVLGGSASAQRLRHQMAHLRLAQPGLFAASVHRAEESQMKLHDQAHAVLRSIMAERTMHFPPFPSLRTPSTEKPIIIKMKLPMQSSGWAARLMQRGYRVSSRSERFGRQVHVIKKDGTALQLIQGGSTVVQNKLAGLSVEQHGFLGDLREVGALLD
jgi:cobalamin biosynthesis Mg chelatase CobN